MSPFQYGVAVLTVAHFIAVVGWPTELQPGTINFPFVVCDMTNQTPSSDVYQLCLEYLLFGVTSDVDFSPNSQRHLQKSDLLSPAKTRYDISLLNCM